MLATYEQHSKRKLITTVLAIVIIAGIVVLADHFKSKDTLASKTVATTSPTTSNKTTTSTPAVSSDSTATSTTPSTAATPSPTPAAASSSGYKDGTYTATSEYYVPHGNESIQVNVTLSNGVITSSSIQNSESDRDSARFQEDFASVYKNYVVGKRISGLQLGALAGASDTAEGFNQAIEKIASQAQA